jgi:hypothetical protein
MGIARFLEKIWCDVRLIGTRPHPSRWPRTDKFFNHFRAFSDNSCLVLFPKRLKEFSVRATMADHVIATLPNFFDDIGVVIADCAIEKDTCRKLKFIEQLEQTPVSNPIAVVAPKAKCSMFIAI